jgi:hypothetical protein
MDWTFWAGARDFLPISLLAVEPTHSCLVGTEALSPGYIDQGTKPTTHLHLVPSLRVSLICLHALYRQNCTFLFRYQYWFPQTPCSCQCKSVFCPRFSIELFFKTLVNRFYINSNVKSADSLFVNYYTHRIRRLLAFVVSNETKICKLHPLLFHRWNFKLELRKLFDCSLS